MHRSDEGLTLDHGCCVFPLIEFGCSRDFAVDSVEDCFADSASDLLG